MVARIGGDEFVLFVKEPDFEQQLNGFIEQLQSTFEAYAEAKYPDLSLSLMYQADQAMYEMKRK